MTFETGGPGASEPTDVPIESSDEPPDARRLSTEAAPTTDAAPAAAAPDVGHPADVAPAIGAAPQAMGWLARSSRGEWLRSALRWLPVAVVAFAIYAWRVNTNPPGFYLDEASLAYNAYSIAQTGADEHGTAFPLFFQTYYPSVAASPVYIYLLAAVFKLVGPSIFAARLVSVTLGFLTAAGIGVAIWRATASNWAAWLAAATALVTPWLFEVHRLVFEVAVLPLVLVGLLLGLQRVEGKRDWAVAEIVAIGGLLGLLTYTYTAGRLLAPMLAVGLLLFLPTARFRNILAAWAVFALALVPALAFAQSHPGVLTARADVVGYITPGMSATDIGGRFIQQVLANISPVRLLLTGDPNIRHHVPVMGSVLLGTLLLAIVGLDRVVHGGWRRPWIRFILYGLLVSLVPASLTVDEFHTLRLIGVPVFLVLLVGVGAAHLATAGLAQRRLLFGLAAITAAQALVFQIEFHQLGPERGYAFDAAFPAAFEAAVGTGAERIYLKDRGELPGYIEAYWYGAMRGIDRSKFVRLGPADLPPSGGVVLGTDKSCGLCSTLEDSGDYIAYVAGGLQRQTGLIPNGDFEELANIQLDRFGEPIYGWERSAAAEISSGGAVTQGAHLVLRHVVDPGTTKQLSSAVVAAPIGVPVRMSAFVRADGAQPASVTIALVESDAQRSFVTWHVTTAKVLPGADWQRLEISPIVLDARTAFLNVSCYLEPGVADAGVDIDDVTVAVNG